MADWAVAKVYNGELFTGVALLFWKSGHLKYKIHYKDGLKHGLKIKWTRERPEDRMKIEEYMYVKGYKHGIYKNYLLEDDDGEEITEEIVEYETKGRREAQSPELKECR